MEEKEKERGGGEREEREGRKGKEEEKRGGGGEGERERGGEMHGKFDSEGINIAKTLINKIKMQWRKIQNLQFKSQAKSKLS